MRAEFCNAAGVLLQLVPRREIDHPVEKIETHAAHAGIMHGVQLGIADATPDGCDAARLAIGMIQRIDHRAAVGAMTGRLHEHVAGTTETIAQSIELLTRSISRRILALGRVLK